MKISAVLIGIILLSAGLAMADRVELEATAKGVAKMDIAVLPFAPEKTGRKPSQTPESVMQNDLLLSGRFRVLNTNNYDSSYFNQKNIAVYTTGTYAYKGDSIVLNCYLSDARSKGEILSLRYAVKEDRMRNAIHKFVDEIVMALFGEKGIALTRITYVRKEGGAKEVYVMDYDGSMHEPITKNKSINLFPSWSPDNREIVFVSYLKNKPDLYIAALSSLKIKPFIQSKGLNSSPEWSGVEARIAYASSASGNTEIYVKDADGSGKAVRLTNHWGIDTSPTWSPSGYEIAFTSDRKGSPQVFIMDGDGANLRRLTLSGKYNDAPAWSPRGDKIAYVSLEDNIFNIYIIGVDGEGMQKLTNGGGSNENPSWSPDGRHICFARSSAGKSDIFVMNDDGSDIRQITFSGNCFMPSWSNF